MRREEFEKLATRFWWTAMANAPGSTNAVEAQRRVDALVQTTVGMAFGEKLLDQEPRK